MHHLQLWGCRQALPQGYHGWGLGQENLVRMAMAQLLPLGLRYHQSQLLQAWAEVPLKLRQTVSYGEASGVKHVMQYRRLKESDRGLQEVGDLPEVAMDHSLDAFVHAKVAEILVFFLFWVGFRACGVSSGCISDAF